MIDAILECLRLGAQYARLAAAQQRCFREGAGWADQMILNTVDRELRRG